MLAAIIVTGINTGKAGVRELLGRMVHWRVGINWHIIAWFSPAILFVFAAVIVRVAWGAWPDFSRFGQTEEFPQLPLLAYWAASILLYGWGEETGWRGFALPRMQKGRSAFFATFILSIFWALWHLPLFWFSDGYMKMGLGGALGWYFSILLGAVLFTWLYNSTQGSILIAAVFHGTADIVFNTPSPGDLATVIGVLMTLWGIFVLVVYKPTTLSRSDKHVIE
jgi:membrane protease YdiL (CAAX protease family)